MRFTILVLVALATIVCDEPNKVDAQICSLSFAVKDAQSPIGSSRSLIDRFTITAKQEDLSKTLHHDASGLNVRVQVEQVTGIAKSQPKKLRISLSVNKLDEFQDSDAVSAETIFDRNWQFDSSQQ